MQRRKSRSKDYDVYSDNDICSQESEDNFAKELQQYIQAKEMANVTQSLSLPEESVKKEGAKDTQKGKGKSPIILSFKVIYRSSHICPHMDGGEGFACILSHDKITFSWIFTPNVSWSLGVQMLSLREERRVQEGFQRT